jgi:hypothetical protein
MLRHAHRVVIINNVACPFFYPLSQSEAAGNWLHAPRVPLGDLQQGECRAQASALLTSTEHCNNGYARGLCRYFPPEAEADAFRFHVIADHGDHLEIQYIVEKACWPVEHDVLKIAPDEAGAKEIVRQQAISFAASYRRRQARQTASTG